MFRILTVDIIILVNMTGAVEVVKCEDKEVTKTCHPLWTTHCDCPQASLEKWKAIPKKVVR